MQNNNNHIPTNVSVSVTMQPVAGSFTTANRSHNEDIEYVPGSSSEVGPAPQAATKKSSRKVKLISALVVLVVVIVGGNVGFLLIERRRQNRFGEIEDWTFLNSLYFSVVSISTVGYGDFTPSTDGAKVYLFFYALFGTGTLAYIIGILVDALTTHAQERWERKHGHLQREQQQAGNSVQVGSVQLGSTIPSYPLPSQQQQQQTPTVPTAATVADESFRHESTQKERGRKRSVRDRIAKKWKRTRKIWIVTLIFLTYIFVGAGIFLGLEGWRYIEAWYFCYVTLFTIGYGDYHPTKTSSRIVCIFFILFGLVIEVSLVTMIGEAIVKKSQRRWKRRMTRLSSWHQAKKQKRKQKEQQPDQRD